MTNAKIRTWEYQIETGNFKSNIAKVLKYIKEHPNAIISDIQQGLQMKYSSVTSAVSVLADEGVIDVVGEEVITEKSGCLIVQSKWQYVSDVNEQVRLQEKRENERFKRYLDSMPNFLNRLDEIEKEVENIRQKLQYSKMVHYPIGEGDE
jgi:DNA-binding transcriptional ArsR family regulator